MSQGVLRKLEDLITLEYGKSLPESQRDSSGSYLVVGSNGVQGFHTNSLVKGPGIVIGRKGSAGQVNMYDQDFWPIDTTYYVMKKVDLNLKWLFHGLKSLPLASLATATGVPGLNRNDVYALSILVPPLADQQRIARILDEADQLRRLRAEANRRTSEIIPALFYEMFGAPQASWPVRKLGDLGILDRGKSRHRPRNESALFGGAYPFVQTGEIANSDGRIESHTQTYSEFGVSQSKLWPAGTLCITIAANIAKTAVLTFPACFPDSVVGFIPGKEFAIEYIRAWLETLAGKLEEEAPQSAQKNINLQILRNLEVSVPPLDLQRSFAERVKEIYAMKASQVASARRLDDLFQSFLHRAFQGEL